MRLLALNAKALTDPHSGLPAGRLIEDQLRRIIRQKDWVLMDIRLNYFEAFKDLYGFIAANDVLRFTAMMLAEITDGMGNQNDFIGHAGGDNFVLITTQATAEAIRTQLKSRFDEEVLSHYNFIDRQLGHIVVPGQGGVMTQTPLMTMAIGSVSPSTHSFADIREITEIAAEERRKDNTTSIA
jgi:GGDEF domain-containing protein